MWNHQHEGRSPQSNTVVRGGTFEMPIFKYIIYTKNVLLVL
jgi:hypothetical protein